MTSPRTILVGVLVGGAVLLGQEPTRSAAEPLLPPWDSPLWQPLPLPEPGADATRAPAYDYALVYDVASGRTERVATPPPLALPIRPGSGGAIGAEQNLVGVDDLGELTPVSNPDGYPWRFNARLFTAWPGAYGLSSAAMIDPYHAITAGHAVFSDERGGFALSSQVVPAYDAGKAPFGSAKAVSYMVWPGWWRDGDYSHDIAIIRLDRPVGALTGWFGIAEFSSCALYTSSIWFNLGYPAQAPFDGEQMFYQFGNFDSCPSPTESRYDAISWGGQSGSAFWRPWLGDRFVFGVLSHGRSAIDPYTDVVRFDAGKLADADTFVGATKPPAPDLTPLALDVPVALAPRGTFVPGVSVLVHNHSTHPFQGNLHAEVYLSRNRAIDQSDTPTSTVYQALYLEPMESRRITFDMWVTTMIAPGFYYVGMELLTPDGNPLNQITMRDDVDQVLVW
ncbi:MAG: hypothetical protein KDE27_32225 [Planctomycetes bacterium]|nr:hypothetical protein [Planctomycetota bacterium]